MENKIKVTVTFEEIKTSRIDALLQEYEAASNLVNATEQKLAPIIKEVGLAKHAAIMKQLEPIMDGMKKLSLLKDGIGCQNKSVKLSVFYDHPGNITDRKFIVNYSFQRNEFRITYCVAGCNDHGYDFTNSTLNPYELMYGADRGIVTHWNKLNIIDKLNRCLEETIKSATQDMIRAKNNMEKKLNNLIND